MKKGYRPNGRRPFPILYKYIINMVNISQSIERQQLIKIEQERQEQLNYYENI